MLLIDNGMRRCMGHPLGYDCMLDVPEDWIYCRDCRLRRQKELAEGMPPNFVPVRELLTSFEDSRPICECGGDPTAPLHRISLLHRKLEWIQAQAAAAPPSKSRQEAKLLATTRKGR